MRPGRKVTRVSLLLLLLASALGAQSLTLDLAFGTNGKVIDPSAGFPEGRAVLVQTDGKILVGGSDPSTGSSFGIKRYLATGAPDPSFVMPSIPVMQGLRGMALQSDGKIVAVGYTGANFGVVRLLEDGTPDPDFDGDGHDSADFLGGVDWAESVAIQADGMIVVSGFARDPANQLIPALARFLSTGGLDPMFGTGGKVLGPPTGVFYPFPVVSLSAEKVVIDSLGRIVTQVQGTVLHRYLDDGELDESFGNMGTATLPMGFEMTSIALAPDDGILIVGRFSGRLGVVKLTSTGDPDSTFGDGGSVTVGTDAARPEGRAVWSRGDGVFYVVGQWSNWAVFLGRFLEDGSPDTTFGIDGYILTPFADVATPNDLAVASGGEVIVAGRASQGVTYAALLVGYDVCPGASDPPPTLTSITPGAGVFQIEGTGFHPDVEIRVGETYGIVTTFQSPELFESQLGPLPIGLFDVTVKNPDCQKATLPDSVLGSPWDVPPSSPYFSFINTLIRNGVTAGCTATMFCPGHPVTRAQMAVFLLRSKEGPTYEPPPATGTVFDDVPIDGFAAAWIEELAARGITAGCDVNLYCPDSFNTRAQMAVFLLVTLEGTGYMPPDPTGVFVDVPVSSPYARWIEELFARGITGGCAQGMFCPEDPVLREQMAVFLSITFSLPG
jgi:uncharacterized delta-60 repeat protein